MPPLAWVARPDGEIDYCNERARLYDGYRQRDDGTWEDFTNLDAATRAQLERGQRVTELMKQKQYSPMSVAEMGLSLFAVNEGYLDKVDAAKVTDYEAALHDFAHANHQALLDKINESGDYSDEIQSGLTEVCDAFAKTGAY